MELLTKATAINPGYAFAYYVKSLVLLLRKAISGSDRSRPDGGGSRSQFGVRVFRDGRAEGLLGRCEQSIAHIKQAFALSPRDPFSGIWHTYLGIAEFCRGRLDAAIEEFKRAIDAGYPDLFSLRLFGGS